MQICCLNSVNEKERQPTKKGICINADLLPKLMKALEKAKKVLEKGQEKPEFGPERPVETSLEEYEGKGS